MTPIKPMFLTAYVTANKVFKKFKNGILAEFNYNGERLQVHKDGLTFAYYGRNLKQVPDNKILDLDFILLNTNRTLSSEVK